MATSFDNTLSALGIKRTTTTVKSTSKDASEMTTGDFIKLMTAQMKNQDPFEPMDNSQMVAQMAQFSSLSNQTEMSTTLKAIATKLGATTTGDALAYVGKTVLTEGKTAYPRTAGGFAGAVELDGAATAVNLAITNASGEVVKTVNLGAQAAGVVNYDWDGTDNAGAAVSGGPFTVSASAKNGTKAVTSRTLVWAPVTSVSMPAGKDPVLSVLGVGSIGPAAVRSAA
ncbi:MAG: flagellar hook capping FlgD N-terminal domain-containing protein [Pseudomonadota bacterium]